MNRSLPAANDPRLPPALRAEALTRRFGDLEAVRGISLEVRRGEVLALLGPNGAGKTTTLRMLAGLLRPDQGRTLVDGRPLEVGSPESRRIGFCPQQLIFWERLTCLEQLTMGIMYGVARADARRRARSLLADLGLTASRPSRDWPWLHPLCEATPSGAEVSTGRVSRPGSARPAPRPGPRLRGGGRGGRDR